MSPPSPFRNFFHAGYVVLDMAKVMDDMRDRFGVAEWKILPLPPGSPAKAIGFAYAQQNMIELVELDLSQALLPMHRGWLPASEGEARLNHLAYMPFPPNWPVYIPKDKLANWFEAYVDAMELNYWTDTEFVSAGYDEAQTRWNAVLRREGATRVMHPRHIVMATGVSGIPNVPDIPSLKNFKGQVVHSSRYDDGENFHGKRALVIGTGNSGHDIAQDLYSSGAEVTLVQRSSTLITNIEPSAQLAYETYNEGTLEDNDLIALSMPLQLARKTHQMLTERSRQLDKALLDGLERVGFKLDFG